MSTEGENADDDQKVGSRCELRIWQERYKRDGSKDNVLVKNLGGEHGFDNAYAIVINQTFTEQNRLEKTTLTINSEHILKAFRDVIRLYSMVAADFSEPFDMEAPFRMLYHYWDDLHAYTESLDDDEARMHLRLLFDFMEQLMGSERARCESQVKSGQVDFSRLWTIYKPGDLQVHFVSGHPWLLKMVKTAYEESNSVGKWMEVHCTYTDYDGNDSGEAKHVFKILQKRHFASENPANIKDLPVYPRKFLEEDNSLEERLIQRGEKFLSLEGVCIRHYNGEADYLKEPPPDFYHPEMAEWDSVFVPFKESGRVVLDRKTFQEDYRLSGVTISQKSVSLNKMLCPPFAYGFSLARKDWCRFHLANIGEIPWNKDAFDSLVMEEDRKRVLKALVYSHSFPENPRDQPQQKGKGLVIVLHGSPGSGKTMTAECAAEITGKALLSTSMPEMNRYNSAWYFEYRLKEVLQYASIWKAVVLLDEADVFLEARKDDNESVERNALVAVFLKHLEYFSGIVFLTTNRIGVFDGAMKSRIHLALGYRPPELDMRRMIWKKSLQAVPAEDLDGNIDDMVEKLLHEKMNGREIANLVNTARTLARFEERPLRLNHLQSILGIRKDFDVSLKKEEVKVRANTTDSKHSVLLGPPIRRGSLLGMITDEPDPLS